MTTAKLTDTKLKSLKPENKQYKATDGTVGGLYVMVLTSGKKSFRLNYTFNGKEQTLAIGLYPEISLAEAREKALEAKKQLARGINPMAEKKESKKKLRDGEITFFSVANDWLDMKKLEWSERHFIDNTGKFNLHVFPQIGSLPMADVTKDDIKVIFDSLQAATKYETREKVSGLISQVYQYALDMEIEGVTVDWTERLNKLYSRPLVKHRAAIKEPDKMLELMRAIESYKDVNLLTAIALKFSALTFCRPGEICNAEWSEIDWKDTLWCIPASKMKMKREHVVPLANQTIELLEQLKWISGDGIYLFPNVRTKTRPMSNGTVRAALLRMGYAKEEMSAHGFRGMACLVNMDSVFILKLMDA